MAKNRSLKGCKGWKLRQWVKAKTARRLRRIAKLLGEEAGKKMKVKGYYD